MEDYIARAPQIRLLPLSRPTSIIVAALEYPALQFRSFVNASVLISEYSDKDQGPRNDADWVPSLAGPSLEEERDPQKVKRDQFLSGLQ